jgi:VCBS repeat protein
MKLRLAALALALAIAVASPAAPQMFAPPTAYPAYLPPLGAGSLTPCGAVVADFNGDGNVDMAVIDHYGDPTLVLYLGNALGIFNASSQYSIFDSPLGIAAADLNADGKLDLVVSHQEAHTTGVEVLFGNGAAGFSSWYSTADLDVDHPKQLVLRDVNKDGRLDIVLGVSDSSVFGASFQFVVMLGLGGGLFGVPDQFNSGQSVGTSGDSWTVMDVDGDAKVDILFAAGYDQGFVGDGVVMLRGNGDGTFDGPFQLLSEPELEAALGGVSADLFFQAATAADVDGDGRLDFVFADRAAVYWARAPGNGTLSTPKLIGGYPSAEPSYIRAVDFDKNGRVDVGVAGRVFLRQPSGSWLAQAVSYTGADMLAARDVNHDALVDLVTTGFDGNHIAVVFDVDPLLADGFESGNFTPWLGGKKP